MRTRKLLIAGLTRNCGHGKLEAQVSILAQAFKRFSKISWLLIESDSSDNTLSELEGLKSKIPNFEFKSLGNLESRIQFRTERIAYCRNNYLSEIKENAMYGDVDYVAVVDFDGVNSLLSSLAVDSCWLIEDWEVCTANQAGPYYDIWALRHSIWAPGDCWLQYHFLVSHGLSADAARFAAVYSKMIQINPNSGWLRVESAFGGLGIYRRSALQKGRYLGVNEIGTEICEHVSLHEEIIKRGGRIYINPSLINADFIDHTEEFRPKTTGQDF